MFDTSQPGHPLVSVLTLSYNHARYIVQCLEGILMQRVDFAFEIVIGDDGSTDGTLETLRAYRDRFPSVIRLVDDGKRVGLQANATRCIEACRGDFIAICEGDDYWIDPLKLRKQVEFLQQHPDHSLCGHNSLVLFEGAAPFVRFFNSQPPIQPITVTTLLHCTPGSHPMHTSSQVLRAPVLRELSRKLQEVVAGDHLVMLWAAHKGGVGYLADTMSVYRKHTAGLTALGTESSLRLYNEDARIRLRVFDELTGHRYASLTHEYFENCQVMWRKAVLKRRSRFLFALRYSPEILCRALRLFSTAWANRH